LEGIKRREEGESKETQSHSGAKCSTVEHCFPLNVTVLLNVFARKDSSIHEYYILICELGCMTPSLSSPTENKVITLYKEQVQTCNNAIQLLVLLLLAHGF
jgi:hypothetical protein